MRKNEFLAVLKYEMLKLMPRDEAEKAVLYYGELIDDATNGGQGEDAFISSLPSPQKIAQRLNSELKGADTDIGAIINNEAIEEILGEPEKQRQKYSAAHAYDVASQNPNLVNQQDKRKRSGGATAAIIVGLFFYSIIVLPIAITLIATMFSLFISMWAVAGSLVAAGFVGAFYAVAAGYLAESVGMFFALLALDCAIAALASLALYLTINCSKGFFKGILAFAKLALSPYRLK